MLHVLKNDSDSDKDCNLYVSVEDEEVAVEDKRSDVVPSLSTIEKVRVLLYHEDASLLSRTIAKEC